MMQAIRDDTLVDIATFLARRWSGRSDIVVEFSARGHTGTRLAENKIIVPSMEKISGDPFARYRQFRVSLWRESMRVRFCNQVLSSDHAFGFILNSMETRRTELLGRPLWRGMEEELVFAYAYMWHDRPRVDTIYGRARIVEAFYQQFLFGSIKGELQQSHVERARRAADAAEAEVRKAVDSGDGGMLQKATADIIKILEIDSLLTVPVSLPWMRKQMPLTQEELLRALAVVSRKREGDFGKIDQNSAIHGTKVVDQYMAATQQDKKSKNTGLSSGDIGVRIPSGMDADETAIYDADLVGSLKIRFRDWKNGWTEHHDASGDEFDEEMFIEGQNLFFTDKKISIKTKIMILLDHSSSIAANQLEYKKATLALCEVLSYLKIKFSVYAFSTQDKAVVCWLVKPDGAKWNRLSAKRLAKIAANGSTPLSEVYDKMRPAVKASSPEIFLTLTDGEPSDPDAVRSMTKIFKSTGVRMVALGLGPDMIRATTIAQNLQLLGYERTLAVSRLGDIPHKVLHILRQ